ncbi:MAG: DUF4942 domain-containing protein [Synergistaceae bacterium]|nr:DUF4942 domain-containing protein [Synergistaceae bacterium]
MLKIINDFDYYPTPKSLLDKISAGVSWNKINTLLEPSAGKGDIAEYARQHMKDCRNNIDLDCIEIAPELQAILKDKNFRVIHDDFLTLHTYKHYDLIIMNPPFSAGAKHLLKAIDLQSFTGGDIICILNAETIRNPYTNERDLLRRKLAELNADINFYQDEFKNAENKTDVEIAVIKINIPAEVRRTAIFDNLRDKEYKEPESKEFNEIAPSDMILALIAQYNREIEWGVRLFDEWQALNTGALNGALLFLSSKDYITDYEHRLNVNKYVYEVRRKYWRELFDRQEVRRRMTSNLYYDYISQLNTFADYDFSFFNIKTLMIDIMKNLAGGVEACIIKLFDELSRKYAWDEEVPYNIHYYDGWATNKSWYINKKVILPINAWDHFRYSDDLHLVLNTKEKIADIEKALAFLNGEKLESGDLLERLREAELNGSTKNIPLKYFNVTFYKKGTCHITFTNERLLKKLNIFGSQRKNWLPKGYGRKKYKDFTPEEQHVIDSFEGAVSYEQTVQEAQYYLFDGRQSLAILHE